MIEMTEEDADLVLKVLREKLDQDSKRCDKVEEDAVQVFNSVGIDVNEDPVLFKEACNKARKEVLGDTKKAIEIMTCGSNKS